MTFIDELKQIKQSALPMQLKRILPALILALGAMANAQTNSVEQVRSITLQEAIQLGLENNLDVKIQRFNPTINRFNVAGAYAIYEPIVSLSAIHSFRSSPGGLDEDLGIPLPSRETEVDSFDGALAPGVSGFLPTGTRYGLNYGLSKNETLGSPDQYSGDWNISLQQPLLRDFWIDAGRAQIKINRKALKISELALLQQIMLTVNEIEQAYYNLIFARENVRVLEKALELAERTAMETAKRVEVGAMAPLEEKQAESQVATSRANLLEARRTLQFQQNTLKNLVVDNFPEWHSISFVPVENLIAVPATYDVQESWRKGLTLRPDLQQLRVDLERRDINLKYQKNQLLPALDLVGSYGHVGLNTSYGRVIDDLTRDDNPNYTYGVRLSVPVGNISARNRYKATKAEKEQAILQVKRAEQDVMVQIDDAVSQAQTAFQRVEATRQARLFAEAALEAEQKKLENGKGTTFLVLDFQSRLTAARFEEIRALAEYNNALAQLAFREGATLQRHNLEADLKSE